MASSSSSSSSRKITKVDRFGAGMSSSSTTNFPKEMEALSVSRRLMRALSENIRRNKKEKSDHEDGGGCGGSSSRKERTNRSSSSSKCLNLYTRGGGCSRVSSCEDIEISDKRRLSFSEDCLPLRGVEKTGVECFSKRNSRKMKAAERCLSSSSCPVEISLPDDVLELILARLPLSSLVAARLVCKRWSQLTMTPQFIQLRIKGFHQSPWLFLFSISVRDTFHAGEIHALDVAGDQWHRISIRGLTGRFMFSVASIDRDVYIVGGCSTVASSSDSVERGTFKALKDVLVFSPLAGSCREVSPMKVARSGAALGVFEVSPICSIFHSQCKHPNQGQVRLKTRIGGVSDVYEDPHRFSLRRQFRDAFEETGYMSELTNLVGQGSSNQPKFALVVVGGRGSWDEPLDSGEVYDPMTDSWIEIARLPRDFGAAGSGAVCQGKFYVYSEAGKLAVFDLERGFWILIQTPLPPRLREFSPKLVSCKSQLFMCCVCWSERDGQVNRREKAVRKVWELDLMTHTWAEVSRHPDAPMDSSATFVADDDRIYGFEMFRIFGQVLNFVTACHISDTQMKWSRISRKHVGHAADASSCTMKSIVVLHV